MVIPLHNISSGLDWCNLDVELTTMLNSLRTLYTVNISTSIQVLHAYHSCDAMCASFIRYSQTIYHLLLFIISRTLNQLHKQT
jgi:hypothetical protein